MPDRYKAGDIMIRINSQIIDNKFFPDNTKLLRYVVHGQDFKITWCYDNDEEMIILFYLVSHIRSIVPYASVILEMPYIPNARMDRIKNADEVFTLKYFSKFINSMNFQKVIVYDPHSNVSTALIDRIEVNGTSEIIKDVMDKIEFSENDILFYPDAGCAKKYEGVLSFPYLKGEKERDWRTGKINNLRLTGHIPENGFRVLIIDDICSKGGTFFHSAKKLKEAGAGDIYLYITHCENTILEGELIKSGLIRQIFTTDSVFTAHHSDIQIIRHFR